MPWRRVAAATRLFGRDRRASGVGLKAITHWTTEYLEFVDATGCGKDQKENDLWRRLESADTWDVGKANRSWDKYFWLFVISLNVVFTACILVSYSMPTTAPKFRVHFGRLGGLVVMFCTLYVADNRRDVGLDADDDECAAYYTNVKRNSRSKGYTVTEALLLTLVLALAAILRAAARKIRVFRRRGPRRTRRLAHLSIDFRTMEDVYGDDESADAAACLHRIESALDASKAGSHHHDEYCVDSFARAGHLCRLPASPPMPRSSSEPTLFLMSTPQEHPDDQRRTTGFRFFGSPASRSQGVEMTPPGD